MISYERGEDGVVATCEVRVGVERRRVTVALGQLGSSPGPDGLRGIPVVVAEPSLGPIVRAGALRAGGSLAVAVLPADAPHLGGRLLAASAGSAEVVVVEGGGAPALTAARALGGRPILPAPLGDPTALQGLEVDVHVAVPSGGDTDRAAIRALVAPLDLERLHHVVEVDPRAAFDELGLDVGRATPVERGAAAAGVLAGRLAVGGRRWRADADPNG